VGHKSYDWVQSHNIVAFYDDSDPTGSNFEDTYCNRKVKISKNGVSFEATIVDTCGNGDCDGCCAKNAKPSGYLIDVEYWTAMNNWGTTDAADGQVTFQLLD
jgi:hypothetical protein